MIKVLTKKQDRGPAKAIVLGSKEGIPWDAFAGNMACKILLKFDPSMRCLE